MEVVILGTAAAEGWPAAYCDCAVCEAARRCGGKDLRMRSGVLIDGDLKIDHGPDTVVHMMRLGEGRSMTKVRTVLVTHEHPDHLFASELKRTTNLPRDWPPQPEVAVYGNRRVMSLVKAAFAEPRHFRLDLRPVIGAMEEFVLADGTRVLALAATHCEEALLFRVERGGRSLFYGHDSAGYSVEVLDALGQAGPLDVALLDCTHTTREMVCKHHMNIAELLRMVEELRGRGAIVSGRTRVIATHFSPHSGAKSHEELVEVLEPHGVEVAFDGMVVNVR
ncbi:MAG: MBL fold metallo-hydrolase [Phycisphaerales bacterium]|nr:MBL fold metallo-hydrolase [Phycisphaerales bacterium]